MVGCVSKRRGSGPAVAAALAFGLLLSGCAGAQAKAPSASPTGSLVPTAGTGAPTPTTTPTPTQTPTAMDLNDPSSWVVGFTRVGPLEVGDEMSAATRSMTAFAGSNIFEGCPSFVSFDKPGFPNVVITDSDGGVEQIVLQGGQNPSEFIATSPQTNSGIRIGATLDELETAYPTLIDLNDYFYPHYALPDGNGNWIHFAVADDSVYTIVVNADPSMPRELCG